MPEYRRMRAPGGTFFLALVRYERAPLFRTPQTVDLLRMVLAGVGEERSFQVVAALVLPDHLRFLWEPPEGDTDFSTRVGLVKACFTRALLGGSAGRRIVCSSRQRRRERAVWQRRSWEHTIRDADDFGRHLDYVHYNPVKHGLAACPHAWSYSSFHRWVRRGLYAVDWQCLCIRDAVQAPRFDGVAATAGE